MSFTQFFENLSHDINNSRAARNADMQGIRTHVHEMRDNVENLLRVFRSKREQTGRMLKHDAEDLKRRLKGDTKARVAAAREMTGEIRARIGGIFSFTHGMLHDLAADLHRGGEIFKGNSATSSPKESRKKKRQ